MRIHVAQFDYTSDWYAYDMDTFDGAEDAGPQTVGYGATKKDAIKDLLQQIKEYAP